MIGKHIRFKTRECERSLGIARNLNTDEKTCAQPIGREQEDGQAGSGKVLFHAPERARWSTLI